MASVSSAGIGSGLDVSAIITGLMSIERQPLNKLETAETKIKTQISEVGKIKSALSKFKDLATKVASVDFWKTTTGTSSNSTVGVTTSSKAATGDYSVEVQSLAKAQSLASGTFASSTSTLSAGTLSIELGTWGINQSTFTAKTGATAMDITVEATDTLATIRDKINAAGAGVTASILTDASGARLLMRSSATGVENAFRTTVTPSGGALDSLAFDPSQAITGATQSQAASDLEATINELPVTSASNSLTDVIDGISLTVSSETTAPVTVSVLADTETIKKTLQDFATAYSELSKLIVTDTKYDASTKTAAALQGDSAIIGLQTRMRSMIGASSGASTAFARLSDAGFEMQQDGTLSVNGTKLDKALANLSQLKLLFSNSSTTDPTLDGFGKRFRVLASDALGMDGMITARTEGLQSKLERNQDSQERMELRLEQTQKRLEAQYTALDAKIAKINSLGAYVTQQVAAWSKT